jgi:hypothetical protein
VFPFRQVTGSIRASLLRQVLLFFFSFYIVPFLRSLVYSFLTVILDGKKKMKFPLFVSGFFQLLANCYYYFRILIGCTPHAKKNILFSFHLSLFDCLLSSCHSGKHTTSHTHVFKKNLNDTKDSEPELEDHVEDVDVRRKKGKGVAFSFFTSFSRRIYDFCTPFFQRCSLPFYLLQSADFLVIFILALFDLFWFTSKYPLTFENASISDLMFFALFLVTDNFYGMGKEVENLILENNELLATK